MDFRHILITEQQKYFLFCDKFQELHKKMVKIGNLELGKKACIAAIIDEMLTKEQLLESGAAKADLFEMRIDCFSQPVDKVIEYVRFIKDEFNLPMIGTVRETNTNRGVRTDIFRKLMPYVDGIDLELGTPISNEVLSFAEGKTVIISEHDFNGTPSFEELSSIVERSLSQGAHIVKIAAMANCGEDVTRILRFTEDCNVPLVTISMGEIGAVSRVIAPLFGSLYTYGYLTRPVAPGQFSVKLLLEEINLFFPD
jgi:3-dehydroquinate dehydratase I